MNSVLSKMVLGSFAVPQPFGQVTLVSRPSDITANFLFLANLLCGCKGNGSL